MALNARQDAYSAATPTAALVLFENAQDESLHPAREVLNVHAAWDAAVRDSGERVEYDTTMQTLRGEIETMRRRVPEVVADPEPERVSTNLITAFRARKTWKQARNQTARLPGKWVQKWLDTFSSFLTNYSGIVEVVKGADNQFGGLAYGTLSVLLCIPVNKSQHESEIEDALEQFALSFPRLQILQGAYPEKSDTLKGLIARVYAEVIIFARECVLYYQKSSLGRLTETMAHPPKTGIRLKVATIRQTLSEIRLESEILLHQRIAELQDNSRKLIDQVQSLQSHLSDVENDKDQQNLSVLRSLLRVDPKSPHLDVAAYKGQLDYVFSDIESSSEEAHQFTLEKFRSEPIVKNWINHPGSSMVVLSGQSWESVTNSTLCWISYASLLAIEHFRAEAIVAHYFCQTTSMAAMPNRMTLQDIAASLWFQISTQAPYILRSGLDEFRRAVESPAWSECDDERILKTVQQAFIHIFSHLTKGTKVILVLDRLDRCQTSLKSIMILLLKLVRKADCTVKFLVVLQSRSSREYLPASERRKLEHEDFYYEKLDWDQEDTFE